MSRWLKIITALLLVFAMMPVLPARAAQAVAPCDYEGTHDHGAIYCIEMPPAGTWNGSVVVFAHGYVPVTAPVDIARSQMYLPNVDKDGKPDGTVSYIPDLVNAQGYAFATTSYSVNGLAIVQGQRDIIDLMDVFKEKVGKPKRAYLVGASEGGLITTLMIENHPKEFNGGGLALCGPIGNFNDQINYWGNFRVAFDYYFPGVLPPSAVNIPQPLIDNWDTATAPGIGYALATNPAMVGALLQVTGAPFDPADPTASAGNTVLGLLWYNVFATNNGVDVLHGQPFDNHNFLYTDPFLDQAAPRFTADKKALKNINENYQTSGKLRTALVTMHTTGDPIVPFSQDVLYGKKVLAHNKGGAYLDYPVNRYGHCNFNSTEVLSAFAWLTSQPIK
jgi:pimeloyl-ACP methyl ester carboxylesterase